MAWTVSGVFSQWSSSIMGHGQTASVLPAAYGGLVADTVNVALFNTTTTPDKDAALTSTGFNTGVWTTTNEVTDATNWVSGGRALAGKAITNPGSGVSMYDATDLAGGGTVTIVAAFGCLVYDNTITAGTGGIAKQGVCFNYFGGSQSVTAGTFTIVWNANGVMRITSS